MYICWFPKENNAKWQFNGFFGDFELQLTTVKGYKKTQESMLQSLFYFWTSLNVKQIRGHLFVVLGP